MGALSGKIWLGVFGIDAAETTFERRGFRAANEAMRERLERVGSHFRLGYHEGLTGGEPIQVAVRLMELPAEYRGFSFEGAAMAFALKDWFTPWNRNRFAEFLLGPGGDHIYVAHVGVGWAMARLPGALERFLERHDRLLRWLLVDGYGFHEVFFKPNRYLEGGPQPSRVHGYAKRAFDQGIGRCLWFVEGGDIPRILDRVAGFPVDRRSDLWSGIGLAAVYAGGAEESELTTLKKAAGEHFPELAQGAAFAAKALVRGGSGNVSHEKCCQCLCGLSLRDAALRTDEALENLPEDADVPAYEIWRCRIQQHWRYQTALSKVS